MYYVKTIIAFILLAATVNAGRIQTFTGDDGQIADGRIQTFTGDDGDTLDYAVLLSVASVTDVTGSSIGGALCALSVAAD